MLLLARDTTFANTAELSQDCQIGRHLLFIIENTQLDYQIVAQLIEDTNYKAHTHLQ